jgi:DNA-binding transcriptional MerR regulator
MSTSDPLWTIAELGERVARALSVDYEGQSNGQVRDIPDRRTIRYYTTIGLIDRPAEMRGRTALYGRRHLLQLVAVKRLQAAGHSLVEIQKQLLGFTTAALGEIARLPGGEEESAGNRDSVEEIASAERPAGPFWTAQPAPARPNAPSGALIQTLHSIPLSEDASLLLTASVTAPATLTAEDVEAIGAAAEPLLQLLESRRLIRPRQQRGT